MLESFAIRLALLRLIRGRSFRMVFGEADAVLFCDRSSSSDLPALLTMMQRSPKRFAIKPAVSAI